MPTYDWKPFREQWSRELIVADQADVRRLPAEVVESGWLGFPGVTEEQIAALEARLEMALPPSYRQFLAVSNGWRSEGFGLDLVLWGTEDVEWFRTINPNWLAQLESAEADMNRSMGGYRHPDDYMPDVFDSLKIAPQIGTGQQQRVYLFDPREVIDGEWQAWTINRMQTSLQQSMRPKELELYDSFWELMQALYAHFRKEAEQITKSKAWQPPVNFVPPQYDWRPFLEQYSRDLTIRGPSWYWKKAGEVIPSDWAGYEGATEAQIAALEARIGARLPPSYRQFLAVSNGWRDTGSFIYKLWSTEEVDWFRVRNSDWIGAWNSLDEDDTDPLRREMKTALEISDVGDSAILLLNPQVIAPDGEWEAWFFANWIPGEQRYRSFWDLMHAQYESMITLSNHEAKRLYAETVLTQLPDKLSGLVDELREKAALFTSFSGGFAASLQEAQAQALNEVADQVQKLIDKPRIPGETLIALRDLIVQAEQERVIAEAAGQRQLKDVLGDVSRLEKDPSQFRNWLADVTGNMDFDVAAKGMAAKGRAQGLSSAAAIIRWFLNDYSG